MAVKRIVIYTRYSSDKGPPNTMKPSSTSPSMKAACASQSDCSSIGRERSQAGPDRLS